MGNHTDDCLSCGADLRSRGHLDDCPEIESKKPELSTPKERYAAIVSEFNKLSGVYMQDTRIDRIGALIFGAIFMHAMKKAGFKADDALKVFAMIEGIGASVQEAGL